MNTPAMQAPALVGLLERRPRQRLVDLFKGWPGPKKEDSVADMRDPLSLFFSRDESASDRALDSQSLLRSVRVFVPWLVREPGECGSAFIETDTTSGAAFQ